MTQQTCPLYKATLDEVMKNTTMETPKHMRERHVRDYCRFVGNPLPALFENQRELA